MFGDPAIFLSPSRCRPHCRDQSRSASCKWRSDSDTWRAKCCGEGTPTSSRRANCRCRMGTDRAYCTGMAAASSAEKYLNCFLTIESLGLSSHVFRFTFYLLRFIFYGAIFPPAKYFRASSRACSRLSPCDSQASCERSSMSSRPAWSAFFLKSPN